jgi:hypothetical protein
MEEEDCVVTATIKSLLKRGSWNPLEIVLTPATAETVGRIRIKSIKTNMVYLSR